MLNRRELIAGLGAGLILATLAAEAQQTKKVLRIGFRDPASPSTYDPPPEAFRRGLGDRVTRAGEIIQ